MCSTNSDIREIPKYIFLDVKGYSCPHCEKMFLAFDSLAKRCPYCGRKAKVIDDWKVELVDWDLMVE